MADTNIPFIRIFVALIIVLSFFSSCATEVTQKEIKGEPAFKTEPVLPVEAIDKKISALENLLENNKVREEDRVMAANLILDYHRIKALMQDTVTGGNLREIILMLFNNLSLLDEQYFTSRKQADIAPKEYQKLIEDMEHRQAVLDTTTEKFNTQNNETMRSDQVLQALLDKESNIDSNARIRGMLKEIDNLINKRDYTGARLLLLKWKLRSADEPGELAEISRALTTLDLSENEYLNRLKTDTNELMAQAAKLIEEEDYESAINILDLVKGNDESSPEVEYKRAVAVEKLINQERNRAARIFLTAKKTNDISKKRELLLSAQNILAGLIEKYPSSEMAEKIKGYLNSVNHELDKIGDR